jgi:AraC family transcriptional regulator
LSRLHAEAFALILLEHLRRVAGDTQPEVPKRSILLPRGNLARVLEYMNENANKDLSLVTLADLAAMSVSHFARSFKTTLGITPHCYLLQGRVERAKSLLAACEQPIAEIALECGFASQAHFTTVFRRITGMTPRSFRRSRNTMPVRRTDQL